MRRELHRHSSLPIRHKGSAPDTQPVHLIDGNPMMVPTYGLTTEVGALAPAAGLSFDLETPASPSVGEVRPLLSAGLTCMQQGGYPARWCRQPLPGRAHRAGSIATVEIRLRGSDFGFDSGSGFADGATKSR